MKVPANLYGDFSPPYLGLPEIDYPLHEEDVIVTNCGRACIYHKKINIAIVLAGPKPGIKVVDNGIWLVSLMRYVLGFIDLEQGTLQTIDNPLGTGLSPCLRNKLVPMLPGWTSWRMAERVGFEPTIRLPVCRISSAVLSTTQPPLRMFWSAPHRRGVFIAAFG